MFETVAPPAASRPSRSAWYEALTFSLCVHAIAGVGAAAMYLWQVTFPSVSPPFNISFVLATPDPPPPPPPPPRPLQPEEKITPTEKIPNVAFLAPTVIPDTIPVVKPEAVTPMPLAIPEGVIGGISEGEIKGVVGGTAGGAADGQPGGTEASVVADDGRVHIARDKKLPLRPVSQTYPNYPEDARIRGWEDELVVRYLIGKDGRVKDVVVLQKPERDVFIDATVRAIRSWRFKPFMKDGEAQEVVHELTVYYRLNAST